MDPLTWISDFREGRIPPSNFRHADHVRLAWAYLRSFGLECALVSFPEDLRRFATAAGAPGKFNATLTEAWLRLVNNRMQARPEVDWEGFTAANGDLSSGDPFSPVNLSP